MPLAVAHRSNVRIWFIREYRMSIMHQFRNKLPSILSTVRKKVALLSHALKYCLKFKLTTPKQSQPTTGSSYKQIARPVFMVIILLSVVINILFLVLPMFSMQVFDRVLSSQSTDTLVLLLAIALFLVSIQASLDWFRSQILLRASYQIENNAASMVLKKEIYCISSQGGMSSARADLEKVREVLSSPGIFSLFDAPFIPLFLLVMYIMHPALGNFTLAGATILILVALFGFFATRKLNKETGSTTANFQALIRDWLFNAKIIQTLGMSQRIVDKWRSESVNSTVDKALTRQLSIHIATFSRYIRMLLQLGILSISVLLVLDQQVSSGVLIAASMVMGRVLAPIEQSIHHWQHWISAFQAHKRLKAMDNNVQTDTELLQLDAIEGNIKFDKASFGGNVKVKPLFEALTISIISGKVTAIVGSGGSGKSTLLQAILGLKWIASGEVRIDGASLNQYDLDVLGQQIGYLPQYNKLLAGTIAQNICRFEPNAESDTIISITKKLGVHEKILNMPQGYQTLVGSIGVELSAGEQQLIALAQAFYGDPALLILDEPDSHLDYVGQKYLFENIQARKESGKTTIVVTHRQSLLDQSDYTLILNKGKVSQFGSTSSVVSINAKNQKEAS